MGIEELHGGLRREEEVDKLQGGLLRRAKWGVVLEAGGWLGARARGSPRRRQTKPLPRSSNIVVAVAGS